MIGSAYKSIFQTLKTRYEKKEITFWERWLFIPFKMIMIDVKYFFKKFNIDHINIPLLINVCFYTLVIIVLIVFMRTTNNELMKIEKNTRQTSESLTTSKNITPTIQGDVIK